MVPVLHKEQECDLSDVNRKWEESCITRCMSFKERNILLIQFSVIVTDEYTGFVPFSEQKIHKDFSKTFKDTFPTFQGLLSVQKRALSLCLF